MGDRHPEDDLLAPSSATTLALALPKATGGAPRHAQAQMPVRGVTRRTFIFGSVITIALVGMILVLLCFICVAHTCTRSGGRILISTAPLGQVLTISQVASHVAPVTVPLIMGLLSYQLGAQWLRASADAGANRPSPLQLGLLLSICNGANFPALFRTLKYVFRLDKYTKHRVLAIPPILQLSIITLSLMLFMSYLISGADAWFHASSSAVSIRSTGPYEGLSMKTNFGRQLNTTRCANPGFTAPSLGYSTCGMITGGSGGNGRSRQEGLRTVSNSSSLNRVEFAHDQTAILVPQVIPPNVTYKARTHGVRTSCTSITKQCVALQRDPSGILWYGPNAFPILNCTGNAKFNASSVLGIFPQAALDNEGQPVFGYLIPSNPFHVGAVVVSQAYYDADEDHFVPNTGWFIHGNGGAWNVVHCNVTVLDVTYSYESSRFVLLDSVPTALQPARLFVTLGFETTSSLGKVIGNVDGAGLQTSVTYEQAFALELAKWTLGLGAVLYEPMNAFAVQLEKEVIGCRLDLIPLILMVVGTFIFSCFVIYIVIHTAVSTARVPYVRLASLHLTDPLTTVHALYGPVDHVSTWQDEPLGKFGQENEMDRLAVGPVHDGAAESGNKDIFIVTKGINKEH